MQMRLQTTGDAHTGESLHKLYMAGSETVSLECVSVGVLGVTTVWQATIHTVIRVRMQPNNVWWKPCLDPELQRRRL